jgi:hypothetical protein
LLVHGSLVHGSVARIFLPSACEHVIVDHCRPTALRPDVIARLHHHPPRAIPRSVARWSGDIGRDQR